MGLAYHPFAAPRESSSDLSYSHPSVLSLTTQHHRHHGPLSYLFPSSSPSFLIRFFSTCYLRILSARNNQLPRNHHHRHNFTAPPTQPQASNRHFHPSSSNRGEENHYTTMSSIVQSIQRKGSDYLPMRSGRLGGSSSSLPLSQPSMNKTAPAPTDSQPMQLRRRLSSLSLNLQPISSTTSQYSNSAYSWALHRSKSLSSMGENAGTSVRKWWEWGWSWVMSRKPGFAQDLEMNEEEMKTIGTHGKGSWRHVFYKVGNEFRKLIRSDSNVSLPTSYRYDSKKLYAHSNSAFQKDAAFLARSATVH